MSDGINDHAWEDDYDTRMIRDLTDEKNDLQERLNYFEKFDHHFSHNDANEIIKNVAKLYHSRETYLENSNGISEEEHLIEIQGYLDKLDGLIPESLKESLDINKLERKLDEGSLGSSSD